MTWFMRHCWLTTTAHSYLCGHNLMYIVITTILPATTHGQQLVVGANAALLADRLTESTAKPWCKSFPILHTPIAHGRLYIGAGTPRCVPE